MLDPRVGRDGKVIGVESELIGIGRMAGLSGLSVSALRFYDGAGVLVPAAVDPANGYRGYAPAQLLAARIVAHLRRVGMPLADIGQVLREPATAAVVLEAYLQRLQDGLTDARRELCAVRALLEPEETPMRTITLPAPALLSALDDIRFAAGTDPELPMLASILLDLDAAEGVLRVVATDRYRLAVSSIAVDASTDSASILIPTALADQVTGEFAGNDAGLTLCWQPDQVSFSCSGKTIHGRRLDHEFPDYRRILAARLPDGQARQVPVDRLAFQRAVADGPVSERTREQDGQRYQVSVLTVDDSGSLSVAGADAAPDNLTIGVNREFLLQALAAGHDEQLTLELDGPIGPLAIRSPDRAGSFSILMPVRLT